MRKIKITVIVMLLLPVCVATAKPLADVVFSPQWTAQAQFVGYYVAQVKGFYKDAGLNVRIDHPSPSNSCFDKLLKGDSQFVTSQLTSAMSRTGEGLQLVNVMQTSQTNTQMIVSHTPVKTLKDLKGKRVGRWLSGFTILTQALDRKYRLEVDWIPFVSSVNLFNSGAIDATLCQEYNEYFQLLSTGRNIPPANIIRLRELGYDIPEDGLYVTADYYRRNPDIVRRFRSASVRGWVYAYRHPQEALDITMKIIAAQNVHTNLEKQRWMLRVILNSMKAPGSGRIVTYLRRSSFEEAHRLLYDNGIIKRKIPFDKFTRP